MSGDLSGFSLFELFKTEAEAHAAALSSGLLAIERQPTDVSHIEPLMRAAHSIKGAARIIGLDSIVDLAHVMEDCFIAVQQGTERLTTGRVDQLLSAVDLFQEISGIAESGLDSWLAAHAEPIQQLTGLLRSPVANTKESASDAAIPAAESQSNATVAATTKTTATETTAAAEHSTDAPLASASVAESPAEAAPETKEIPPTEVVPPAASGPSAAEPTPEQRTVPVNAGNLNRIMRLASESMVEARQLQGMQQSLSSLKEVQRRFTQAMEELGPEETTRQTAALGELRDAMRQSSVLLNEHATRLERALWRSERTSTALYHEVIASRMRPFSEGTQAFPRMIRDLSKSLGKSVRFELVGGSVAVDRDILRKLEAPLNHLLRNCVDHGIETPERREAGGKPANGSITLEARHHAGMLTVEVRDDGHGIDLDALRRKVIDRQMLDAPTAAKLNRAELLDFLFLPGFSTASQVTEVSGRGVGLDVVRSMVQEVSGTVRVDSELGKGACFTLHLPVTLSVIRAALAEIAGELYAFPLAKLERIVRLGEGDLQPVQGKQQFKLDGHSVGLVRGTDLFGFDGKNDTADELSVIVVRQDHDLCGIVVDRFVGEQDLVVRPLDTRLGKVPQISAAALTEEGEPLLIVDIDDLFHSMRQWLGEGRLRGMTSRTPQEKARRQRVLVVDDSITVREVERQLLAANGYDVDVAVDGQDGWHALRSNHYDLLVSDVDMPRMNGIELIRLVRQDPQFVHLPIIIVSYKDNEQDRMRGLEVGASAYLTKGSFHDNSFLQTVADLIGDID